MRLLFTLISAMVFAGWIMLGTGSLWVQHKLTNVAEGVRAEQRLEEAASIRRDEQRRVDEFYGRDSSAPSAFAASSGGRNYRPGKPMVDPNPNHRY
jgi:hypothetical protein